VLKSIKNVCIDVNTINLSLLHVVRRVITVICWHRVLVIAVKLVGNLGAEPTTSDFTVVMHGDTYQAIDGIVLVTDQKQQFSALEKYGQVISWFYLVLFLLQNPLYKNQGGTDWRVAIKQCMLLNSVCICVLYAGMWPRSRGNLEVQ